jgi:hypothetical protein
MTYVQMVSEEQFYLVNTRTDDNEIRCILMIDLSILSDNINVLAFDLDRLLYR